MHFYFPFCEVENCIYGLYIYKSNSQHNRANFPYFLLILALSITIIRFSEVFSAYLPGVCVAFCLIHLKVIVDVNR